MKKFAFAALAASFALAACGGGESAEYSAPNASGETTVDGEAANPADMTTEEAASEISAEEQLGSETDVSVDNETVTEEAEAGE